jgi:hypothetical protein
VARALSLPRRDSLDAWHSLLSKLGPFRFAFLWRSLERGAAFGRLRPGEIGRRPNTIHLGTIAWRRMDAGGQESEPHPEDVGPVSDHRCLTALSSIRRFPLDLSARPATRGGPRAPAGGSGLVREETSLPHGSLVVEQAPRTCAYVNRIRRAARFREARPKLDAFRSPADHGSSVVD